MQTDASRPAHHANASRTLFQNPERWRVPEETDDNAVSISEAATAAATYNSENVPSAATAGGALAWLRNIPAMAASLPIAWAQDMSAHVNVLTKVVKPDFGRGKAKAEGKSDGMRATWLGHAVCNYY